MVEGRCGNGECGGRLAGEDSDGVFVCGAGNGGVDQLDARAFELGAGLFDIQLRGDALIEAVLGEFQLLFVIGNGAGEQGSAGVAAA